MFSVSRLLTFACLSISLAESAFIPALQGTPATSSDPPDLNGTTTDTSNIVSTAQQVDQKSGASSDAPPDQPATNTTITAIDGDLVNQTIPTTTSSRRGLYEISRRNDNYEQVFGGTGTGPSDRDASIEGTAYLTYTVVSNATYDVDDCLDYCDSVEGCVFANLYYEFENPLLDLVFSQGSNLKCAVYADVHSAIEKTNFGGQQLYPAPAPLNYIQQSSGWALKSLPEPAAPQGYDKVFGPTGGANNAPGYMGFAFLDQYDVAACAALCDTRGADPVGGACQYFNILEGCCQWNSYHLYLLYGDLVVTQSRGYSRQNAIVDGGFEGYICDSGATACSTSSYANWVGTSPLNGNFDASIFDDAKFAHTGHSVALLGSATNADTLSGTLAPASPITTEAGVSYTLQFFYSTSFTDEEADEAGASLEIIWNGNPVNTITPGYQSQWVGHQTTLVAQGNDILQFIGSPAPAFVWIDDVSLLPLST
ncbi:hypothetical protein BT96DRAFT_976126 [Gymnopus androsaceus JB14]|uniref:Fruit-body specific protein a n=1 Tax=Gymnopus androsaceus JB14 TaxID=1447944 RepID=A0A6A4HJF2_9AGAR|nr:hypothetical protein BT96DRAFT_976126 [Gymnopus androsaceus JB14]